jgi:hypothetical protein
MATMMMTMTVTRSKTTGPTMTIKTTGKIRIRKTRRIRTRIKIKIRMRRTRIRIGTTMMKAVARTTMTRTSSGTRTTAAEIPSQLGRQSQDRSRILPTNLLNHLPRSLLNPLLKQQQLAEIVVNSVATAVAAPTVAAVVVASKVAVTSALVVLAYPALLKSVVARNAKKVGVNFHRDIQREESPNLDARKRDRLGLRTTSSAAPSSIRPVRHVRRRGLPSILAVASLLPRRPPRKALPALGPH